MKCHTIKQLHDYDNAKLRVTYVTKYENDKHQISKKYVI